MGQGASRSRRSRANTQPPLQPPYPPPSVMSMQPQAPPQYPQFYGQAYAHPNNGNYYGQFQRQHYGQYMMGQRQGMPPPPQYHQPPPPQPPPRQEPQRTQTIRNDVNLKKNTLKLEPTIEDPDLYVLSFTFDAAAACSVSVFFEAVEDRDPREACRLTCAKPPAQRLKYEKGLKQTFTQPREEALRLSEHDIDLLSKESVVGGQNTRYPLVVRLETVSSESRDSGDVLESANPPGSPLDRSVQSQTTYATISKGEGGSLVVRVLKQKIWVQGVSYELQEIYGIEQSNSNATNGSTVDDEMGRECVICMSEPRDTTVLPCRHMCMCSNCASMLREQTNRCPICRRQVNSLLKIEMAPKTGGDSDIPPVPA